MTSISDINDVSLVCFPINNNRTAWRAAKAPVILVVPHRRTPDGIPIDNSEVFNVRVYIEKVPQEAKVAGHDHVGLRFPDRELYAVNVSEYDLSQRLLDLSTHPILDKNDGEEKDLADAVSGDLIRYTTDSGVTDTMPYLPGASYYDLSDVSIATEQLPSDNYNLVYEGKYFKRIVSLDDSSQFICIDDNITALAIFRFGIQHPGKVIEELVRRTPPRYLRGTSKADDTDIGFYRPFADVLQDVMDEQDLLERINWVSDAPPEVIPYLSSLLGWDVPYFPKSLDNLRRAVLRRTVEFQNLKGSKRAIVNIFKLFGFEILISNLWWSTDNKRLIRPDELLPSQYEDEAIVSHPVSQVDICLDAYATPGFNKIPIPLLYRPQLKTDVTQFSAIYDGGNLTVSAYIIESGSEAHAALASFAALAAANPSEAGAALGARETNGVFSLEILEEALNGIEIAGYSKLLVQDNHSSGVVLEDSGITAPLAATSVFFNRTTNTIELTLNGHIPQAGQLVYLFTSYKRYALDVPAALVDRQSNKFDIQLLTNSLTEYADPDTLEFTVEFLYRLKAFHSLLNVIRTRADLTETYQVTDMCAGATVAQRFDTDFGQLQVPPAIIPATASGELECARLDPRSLGYKESDITFRLRMLSNLPEEFAAWKNYDGVEYDPTSLKLSPLFPISTRNKCQYTPYGQDRTYKAVDDNVSTVHAPPPSSNSSSDPTMPKMRLPMTGGEFGGTSAGSSTHKDSGNFSSVSRLSATPGLPLCDLDGVRDYCYKGRAHDDLDQVSHTDLSDVFRPSPCVIGQGYGLYWTYPTKATVVVPGTKRPAGASNKTKYSGGAKARGEEVLNTGIQSSYLNARNTKNDTLLSKAYRQYSLTNQDTIHYDNKANIEPVMSQTRQLALHRPSLDIQKAILHYPGCRFPMMYALETDFVSEYDARPWDYTSFCGPKNICGPDQNPLNAVMTEGPDGNEYLSFDSQKFTLTGNGLAPDIALFGEQSIPSGFTSEDLVHTVFMRTDPSHPAVTLDDGVCIVEDTEDDFITTDRPLFNSYAVCGTGEYRDFIDGYPCTTGIVSVGDQDLDRSGLYHEALEGSGLDTTTITTESVYFTYGTGIRIEKGSRYDCGCMVAGCDGTEGLSGTICSTNLYLDQDGDFDWSPDHIVVEAALVNSDTIGVDSIVFDGTVPTMLETI